MITFEKFFLWIIYFTACSMQCKSQTPNNTLYMDSIPMHIIDEILYFGKDTLFFQSNKLKMDTFLISNITLSKARKERFKNSPLNPVLFYYKATYNQLPNYNWTIKQITERDRKEKVEFYDPSLIEVTYLRDSNLMIYFTFKDFSSMYVKNCSHKISLTKC